MVFLRTEKKDVIANQPAGWCGNLWVTESMLLVQKIPTPVCALARNDSEVFNFVLFWNR